MLKIWGRNTSSNVMKVLWLCDELGLEYERIDAGGAFGVVNDAAYLARNPHALVPTLEEEDGWTLWESNTILRYLANGHPGGEALYPADPKGRAMAERWMDWQLSALNGAMTPIFFCYVRTPEAQRDMVATNAAQKMAEKYWGIVEAKLEGKEFLNGSFGLADLALGPYLHRWFAMPLTRPDLPNLAAWYGRLKERPGFAKHVMIPLS